MFMKKYLFVFAFILNIFFGFSQTQLHIEGVVKEAINQSFMENVRIRLLERQVEMCGNTQILLPLFRRDFSIIKGEKITDKTGKFSFLLQENLVEYYALEILFPDQQRQYVSLIAANSPEKQVFSIEYLPMSLSAEAETILERRHYAEKVKLEQEKINTPLVERQLSCTDFTVFGRKRAKPSFFLQHVSAYTSLCLQFNKRL